MICPQPLKHSALHSIQHGHMITKSVASMQAKGCYGWAEAACAEGWQSRLDLLPHPAVPGTCGAETTQDTYHDFQNFSSHCLRRAAEVIGFGVPQAPSISCVARSLASTPCMPETELECIACRHVQVRCIERVQNKMLWRRFALRRKELQQKHGHLGSNDAHLFHGADKRALEAIVNEGFDIRVSKAGSLGQGANLIDLSHGPLCDLDHATHYVSNHVGPRSATQSSSTPPPKLT